MHWSASHDVGWTIVEPGAELDPGQYLGEFGELPVEEGVPGKWCDVVMRDSLGEVRWRFVLTRGRSQCVSGERGEAGSRSPSPRAAARRAGARALREWEREDEAAAASSVFAPVADSGSCAASKPPRELRRN
jgi:hypothetical protein